MNEGGDSRLNLLELKCRRPVEHLLSGEYRSVFKGRGIEFEDTRVYEPGDDVRAMDWRITARTGVPHVKRYVEEREQHFYLVVDLSASTLSDRAGQKRQTIAEFCSLLTLAALKNNDRVGLILFTDRIELVVPVGKGRMHGMRIMDAVLNFEPKGSGTRLGEALDVLGHLARKRSIVFLISDFFASGYERDLQAVAYKHETIAARIVDGNEVKRPSCSLARIHDSETGHERVVDFSAQVAEKESLIARTRERMLECGVDLIEFLAGEDCVPALASFFRSRRRLVADETGG
ncbi:MAG: DUF58 domain-containing protein [Verrucomicrobiota bacterium]